MIPDKEGPDNSDSSRSGLREELRTLILGLREEVQSLREEVKALHRTGDALDGPDSLLTRGEAADVLGISTRTLDDMAEAGEIQPVRIRGRVLYAPATLKAYIRRRAGEGSR